MQTMNKTTFDDIMAQAFGINPEKDSGYPPYNIRTLWKETYSKKSVPVKSVVDVAATGIDREHIRVSEDEKNIYIQANVPEVETPQEGWVFDRRRWGPRSFDLKLSKPADRQANISVAKLENGMITVEVEYGDQDIKVIPLM